MPAGRPHSITKQKVDAICESIAHGSPLEAAARAAGIHPATLFRWQELGEAILVAREQKGYRKRDEKDHEKLSAELSEGIQRARGECEDKLVGIAYATALGRPATFDEDGNKITAEIPPDGRQALEMLGRKFPTRWSKRISVTDDTPKVPAPLRTDQVAAGERAFIAAFGEDALEGVDPENLVPPVFES